MVDRYPRAYRFDEGDTFSHQRHQRTYTVTRVFVNPVNTMESFIEADCADGCSRCYDDQSHRLSENQLRMAFDEDWIDR